MREFAMFVLALAAALLILMLVGMLPSKATA